MSDLDLPASMKPKLAAIEKCIKYEHGRIREGARDMVEAALRIGQELTAAKAIIVPGQWERWCNTALPFSRRWARGMMKLHADYEAIEQPEQIRLLESATSVQSALRVLQPETIIGAEVVAYPDRQIATDDHENADLDDNDAPPEGHISQPDLNVEPPEPPEPDPWQEKKREVRDVFAGVAAAIERLKDQIKLARGWNVFDFVSTVIEQDLANLAGTIKLAKPTTECPTCRAKTPEQAKSCRTCKTIGLVPKQIAERGR